MRQGEEQTQLNQSGGQRETGTRHQFARIGNDDDRVVRSQRPLLSPAFLTRIGNPRLSRLCRHAIGRTALAAFGLDTGVALFDGQGLPLHGLFDETFGLFAHILL